MKKLTQHRIDDACDVFAIHGIGGVVGGIMTGIFAQNSVIELGGDAIIPGGAGAVDGHVCVFSKDIYSLNIHEIVLKNRIVNKLARTKVIF